MQKLLIIQCLLLVALNTIFQSQSNPIQHTAKLCQELLDYCTTYPNVGLRYHINDMVFHIYSDALYLVTPYAKTRIGGYFFLLSNYTKITTHNAPIHIKCKTLCHVVTSSAECVTAAVFHNAQQQFTSDTSYINLDIHNHQLQ